MAPNTSMQVEFLFDEPREFDDNYNPGRTRYGFTLKVREDNSGMYRVGEEVTYFTSFEPEAVKLRAFGRGDVAQLTSVQNPGDRWPSMVIDTTTADSTTVSGSNTATNEGKAPARAMAGSYLYPDENPEIMEMMERCMVAASEIRENLVRSGVVNPQDLGEYWLTKVGLTIWMQVR